MTLADDEIKTGDHEVASHEAEPVQEQAAGGPPDLQPDTLAGDIRDSILDLVRHMPKAWTDLLKFEQDQRIFAAARLAKDLVDMTFAIVTERDFTSFEAKMGKASFSPGGDEIEAKITCENSSDNLIALNKATRKVIIQLASAEEFYGERVKAAGDADQAELKLDPAPGGSAPESAPGGIPLDDAKRKFEAASTAAALRWTSPRRGVWIRQDVRIETAENAAGHKEWVVHFVDGTITREGSLKAAKVRGEAAPAPAQADDATLLEAARERGRAAFLAGEPGIVPDDLAGTPQQEAFLEGWGEMSEARGRSDPAKDPAWSGHVDDRLVQARAALAQGADREKVISRMAEIGLDPALLDEPAEASAA